MVSSTIYIYIKESPKGLFYLGKTTQDPFKYKGSGIHWKRHLKTHNIDNKEIKTYILHETTSNNEVKNLGLYYSSLFNVVKSDKWANMKEETGEGGFGSKEAHPWFGRKKSDEHKQKLRIASTGNKAMLGKRHSDQTKQKQSLLNKGKVYEKIECPYCNKMIAVIKAKQWHFDNCPIKTGVKNSQPKHLSLKGENHPLYGKKRPDHSEFMKKHNPKFKNGK